MRFNDLIPTILSGRGEGQWANAILWRQCVDLLAQYDPGSGRDAADLDPVATTLRSISGQVEREQKLAALRELGNRLTSPRLVRLLLADDAPVQVAAMGKARLADVEWPSIIAEAGPLARSILRRRSDLGAEARRALDAFGLTDMTLIDLSLNADESATDVLELADLAGPTDVADPVAMAELAEVFELPARPAPVAPSVPAPTLPPMGEQSQIRRIVDRIERFTSERQERGHPHPLTVATAASRADHGRFAGGEERGEDRSAEATQAIGSVTFLTDADGVIRTLHGAPTATLAGYRLATPSLDRNTGPDGQILGAFRRRGAFREGRLTIGQGLLAGCWLVDGDPLFDQRSGRFTGYRGIARRARRTDIAPFIAAPQVAAGAQDSTGADVTSDATSLRQLIHELRTPLHGVMGFAELIEAQFLGPVNDRYRSMAGNIVSDVRNLVDILDDLDMANRDDRLAAVPDAGGTDAAALLADAVARLGPDEEGRQRLLLDPAGALPSVDVAPTIAERMIVHFVRALTGCVGTETLGARCRLERDRLSIEIDRPAAMADLSDAQLFDSGFEHVAVNMDAPVLGVGFALRLVRRLAQANKGLLAVHPGHFALVLPLPATIVDQEVSS
ncbi:hypothetical protein LWE61_15520 [Sphingobium sufflavum]|uniref:histidine kinase dimerization/phospho-acceptor domain-containing protein n=1 Tax=Sphingobium sufflavum TaxID=1129547 RepID=UPI001F397B66|nr:histidine kinase dimerization/phospho-acceptor domain-containing protein [Sphingobium sufflavum]MCE7797958.1 hypothetical protein [Sphingobium sufflavum]